MEKLVKKINKKTLHLKKPKISIKPFEMLKTEYEMEIMTLKRFEKLYGEIDEFDLIEKLTQNCTTYSSNLNLNYEDPVEQVDDEYIEYYMGLMKKKRRYKLLLMVYVGEHEYVSNCAWRGILSESSTKQRWLKKQICIKGQPCNRIYGFVIVNQRPCHCKLKREHPYGRMLSIPIICGSPFSKLTNKGGVGAYLMLFAVLYAKEKNLNKIILEVTNHEASIPISEPNILNNEVDEEDYEADNFFWKIPKTKKCQGLWDYMTPVDEDEDQEKWDEIPLEDRVYGGRLYQEGKEATAGLFCKIYEKWGFTENPLLNVVYKCFDISPLPAMELDLKEHGMEKIYKAMIAGMNVFPQSEFCACRFKRTRNMKKRKRKLRNKTRKRI